MRRHRAIDNGSRRPGSSPVGRGALAILALSVALACAQNATAAPPAHYGASYGIRTEKSPPPAPRSFYGVMAADNPTSSETALMAAGGVGTLRINLVWAWVQPDSPADHDWSHYDQVIGDAARQGIRVLPTIYGSPAWAAIKQNYPPWQDNVHAFRAFATAVAQRYGTNGTFWAMHPEIPKLPVRWWQLWNEASSSTFWDATPSAREYVDLLRVFRAGIKDGDPSAMILLSGLFPTPRAPGSIAFKLFLRGIYKRGGKPLFDGAAIHPYGSTPGRVLQRVLAMRRIMDRFNDERTPIWVTEVGWATDGLPRGAVVSPGAQETYLVDTYRDLAAVRSRLKIAGVVWFCFRDHGGFAWFDYTGLLTQDLGAKPAWRGFTDVAADTGS
jgi:polysaccharide biosynthesis protein PslG